MADNAEIRMLARQLNLMNLANGLIDIDDEFISNKEYLFRILQEETVLRAKKKAAERYKGSYLPKKEFDDAGITSGLMWQLDKIREFDFHRNHQNIMIVGNCATGKTALAARIAKDAIDRGASAVYISEDDLINAVVKRNVKWNKILHSDLIVLDELFYIKPSEENLQLLYKTVMFLTESRSIIFVTNRMLSDWDDMGVDKHTVSTFRQRIMAEAQLIHLG